MIPAFAKNDVRPKYMELSDQPRVPAGSPAGGQFGKGSGGGGSSKPSHISQADHDEIFAAHGDDGIEYEPTLLKSRYQKPGTEKKGKVPQSYEHQASRLYGNDLSEDEEYAIDEYRYSVNLNHMARGGGYVDGTWTPIKVSKEDKAVMKHLDTALEKAPVLKRDAVLYRGARMNDEHLANWKVGATVTDKGYTSLTGDRELSKSFFESSGSHMPKGSRDVIMEVKVKAGQKVAPISGIGPETTKTFAYQKERLLPRNANLRITGQRDEGGITVFEMEYDD